MVTLKQNKILARQEKKQEYDKKFYDDHKKEISDKRKKSSRKVDRLEKKQAYNQKFYDDHKGEISDKRKISSKKYDRPEKKRAYDKKFYDDHKEDILDKKGKSYRKTKAFIYQRKRFRKHFTRSNVRALITPQQEHLWHHTKEFCQPETMPKFNHSVQYYDGHCKLCKHETAVKIIAVNRIVCMNCKKAICSVCKKRVSPNPYLGYQHYTPGSCPLYSEDRHYVDLYTDSALDLYRGFGKETLKDCRICEDIKSKYPEYEIFTEKREEIFKFPGYQKETPHYYKCNLCKTEKDFVCQFDQHLRSHTKYGQLVAIVGMKVDIEDSAYLGHVNVENFDLIENEMMKTSGISAVLTIFGRKELEFCGMIAKNEKLDTLNLGALLLFQPGTDVQRELVMMFKKQRKTRVIEHFDILRVKNHFLETYDSYWDKDARKSGICTSLTGVGGHCFLVAQKETKLYRRNDAVLQNRCSLSYPQCIYKSDKETSHLNPNLAYDLDHEDKVLYYWWKVVKKSKLCCCVSFFFCSSSTSLQYICQDGCCGKCSQDESESSSDDSESSSSDDTVSSETSSSETRSEHDSDGDFFDNLSS